MNETVYRVAIISLAVILLLTGTYIGLKISNKVVEETVVPNDPIDKVEEPSSIDVMNNDDDKEKYKDIEVTYEDYYTNCKDTIISKNIEFGTTIDEIKEKVSSDYELIEETEYTLVFRKEIDSNCPNHFELKLVDDYVMIYQIISDEESTMYKNTEIPRSSIRDELITELEKGIRVNTLEELNTFIEDLES